MEESGKVRDKNVGKVQAGLGKGLGKGLGLSSGKVWVWARFGQGSSKSLVMGSGKGSTKGLSKGLGKIRAGFGEGFRKASSYA